MYWHLIIIINYIIICNKFIKILLTFIYNNYFKNYINNYFNWLKTFGKIKTKALSLSLEKTGTNKYFSMFWIWRTWLTFNVIKIFYFDYVPLSNDTLTLTITFMSVFNKKPLMCVCLYNIAMGIIGKVVYYKCETILI